MTNGNNRFPLSAVILARNEAPNIARCVRSLQWCDEIVVIDDGSTDETARLAISEGARVVQHRFESFAKQRNWAIAHAELRHEWILMLDADEVSTRAFQQSVTHALTNLPDETAAFRTCRMTMLGNRWLKYSDEFPCWIMRLVQRDRARFEDHGHGEVPLPDVHGAMGTIPEPFLHYPFSHGISNWLSRHIRYAEREAMLELSAERSFRVADLLALDSGRRRRALRDLSRKLPMRPALRFLYQAILCRGALDGRAGLVFSLLKAIYEGMIIVKKWELEADFREDDRGIGESISPES